MHISLSSWNCLGYGHNYSITALSSRWETGSQNEVKSVCFLHGREIGTKFVICHLRELSRRSCYPESFKIRWWSLFKVPAVYSGKKPNKPTTFFLMDSRDLLWGKTGHRSLLWPVFCKQFGKPVCKPSNTDVQVAQQAWKHQMVEMPTLSRLMKCNPLE